MLAMLLTYSATNKEHFDYNRSYILIIMAAALIIIFSGERRLAKETSHFPGYPDEPGTPVKLRSGFQGTQTDSSMPGKLSR